MGNNGDIINLKDGEWLKRQKIAGQVVASIHRKIFELMKNETSNIYLTDLDAIAKELIYKANCTPTFYKYKGFPSTICTSINKELVHGFSNRKIRLESGDVLKVDIGATFEGAIADCAFTHLFGKCKNEKVVRMLISCQEALELAIKVVEPGRRIGEIGNVIFKKGTSDGFGVITNYGGHGLDYNILHAQPFIPNKAREDEGIVMQPGLSIAIEPMFVVGKNTNTRIMADKWTVMTNEIGGHYEHSITLDQDGKRHIITDHGLNVKDFLSR